MHVDYNKKWSRSLKQDMEFKLYGRGGKPVVVYPSANGRFYDYENFGMVEACRPFIEDEKISLITVDSIDRQSWLDYKAHPADRALRHNDYDCYIMEELIPEARKQLDYAGNFIATGCSMGGYHSANFFFKHPDVFDSLIALSGIYRLDFCIGDYMDDNVYFNSPLAYLPNLEDPWYLDRIRGGRIILCSGRGAWEEEMLRDTLAMKELLEGKNIPAWVDFWGWDVSHDWYWWRKQIAYFMGNLFPLLRE
ncbi:MAG: alpha/beta hydrolase-fold protein [bacterium]